MSINNNECVCGVCILIRVIMQTVWREGKITIFFSLIECGAFEKFLLLLTMTIHDYAFLNERSITFCFTYF